MRKLLSKLMIAAVIALCIPNCANARKQIIVCRTGEIVFAKYVNNKSGKESAFCFNLAEIREVSAKPVILFSSREGCANVSKIPLNTIDQRFKYVFFSPLISGKYYEANVDGYGHLYASVKFIYTESLSEC